MGGVLAKYLAQYYKVLLWNHRNSIGSSDLYLNGTGDPITADANDLHELIHKLYFESAIILNPRKYKDTNFVVCFFPLVLHYCQ